MTKSNAFSRIGALAMAAAPALFISSVVPASADPLTVVELFTSQGCSSCPPANDNLAAIADRPGVLALSYSVTYWDKLGWKDTFGSPKYTERQVDYVAPLGNSSPFTPQMVVNGSADIVGNRLAQVQSLIAKAGTTDAVEAHISGGQVKIGSGKAPSGGADVWLVRYDPHLVEVPVERGENSGRTLPHKNAVHQLSRLGAWSGEAKSFAIPAGKGGLKTAVLVQTQNGGPILAAAVN